MKGTIKERVHHFLSEEFDPEDVEEIYALFLDNMESLTAQLQQETESNKLSRIAHSLKGVLLQAGLEAEAELVKSIELCPDRAKINEIIDLLSE